MHPEGKLERLPPHKVNNLTGSMLDKTQKVG